MRILNIIIEVLTAPFNLLFRTSTVNNPNKTVKPWIVLLLSLVLVAGLVLLYYYGVIFK
ncbi:MAG: hypothetical protein IJU60_02880 [Acholeplasmatales bacterium]|nr:hypothetical protein [Acholeplasmatales bacterium]